MSLFWKDQSVERDNSFITDCWPYRVWPKAEKYRLIEFPLESSWRWGVQAELNGQWVDV